MRSANQPVLDFLLQQLTLWDIMCNTMVCRDNVMETNHMITAKPKDLQWIAVILQHEIQNTKDSLLSKDSSCNTNSEHQTKIYIASFK